MIKPRSQLSHFELQAEAQQRNFEGETNSHSCESFNQLNGQSMLPVMPMVSVTNPSTVDRGSKVSETHNPINSTEAPQPTAERGAISSLPPTPRHQLDPPKMFLQFTILHLGSEWITVTFCVCQSAVENRTISA